MQSLVKLGKLWNLLGDPFLWVRVKLGTAAEEDNAKHSNGLLSSAVTQC